MGLFAGGVLGSIVSAGSGGGGSTPSAADHPLCGAVGATNRALFTFSADYQNRALRKSNGDLIQPDDVAKLYGTPDGFTIYDDGVDVCSPVYAAQRGFARPLAPIYQDLSDPTGSAARVKAGCVAIDPNLGRFKFCEGSSDPPKLVGNLELPNCWANDFALAGDICFASGDEESKGLWVIDIRDPAAPYVRATLGPLPGFSGPLAYRAPYIYMLDGTHLQIHDVRDVDHPKVCAVFPIPAGRRSWLIALAEDRTNQVFIECYGGGVAVCAIDVSDHSQPRQVDSISFPQAVLNDLVVSKQRAFISLIEKTNNNKTAVLKIVDMGQSGRWREIGTWSGGVINHVGISSVFVKDSLLFLLFNKDYGDPKLIALNIANPAHPELISEFALPNALYHPYSPYKIWQCWDRYLIVNDTAQIHFIDITDPRHPQEAWVLDIQKLFREKRGVAGCDLGAGVERRSYPSGEWAITYQRPSHRYVHNVSDLCDTWLQRCAIRGDYLYVLDKRWGLAIVRINDLAHPELVSGIPFAGEVRTVKTRGDKVYLTDFNMGLYVVDVADPTAPRILGNYDDSISYHEFDVSPDQMVFLSHKVLNVAQPAWPEQVGAFCPYWLVADPETRYAGHPTYRLRNNSAAIVSKVIALDAAAPRQLKLKMTWKGLNQAEQPAGAVCLTGADGQGCLVNGFKLDNTTEFKTREAIITLPTNTLSVRVKITSVVIYVGGRKTTNDLWLANVELTSWPGPALLADDFTRIDESGLPKDWSLIPSSFADWYHYFEGYTLACVNGALLVFDPHRLGTLPLIKPGKREVGHEAWAYCSSNAALPIAAYRLWGDEKARWVDGFVRYGADGKPERYVALTTDKAAYILSFGDPKELKLIQRFALPDWSPAQIRVLGRYGYVMNRSKEFGDGIYLMDWQDLAHPRQLAYVAIERLHYFTVAGDYLYATDYNYGAVIYDLRDRRAPRKVAGPINYDYGCNFGLDVDGGYLYRGDLGALEIYQVPTSAQTPLGKVTAAARLK